MPTTRARGEKLTPAQHAQFAIFAWQLSCKGRTPNQIIDLIYQKFDTLVSEKTVDNLLKEQRLAYQQQIAGTRDEARVDFLAAQTSWKDEIRKRLASKNLKPSDQARLIQLGMQCDKEIGDARGVFVKEIDIEHEGEILIRQYEGVDFSQV